jgi:hypothetical protein
VIPGLKDRQAPRAHRAFKECQVLRVHRGHRARKDLRGLLAKKERRATRETGGIKATRATPEKVKKATLGKRVTREKKGTPVVHSAPYRPTG